MSKVLVEEQNLADIGNAIRTKLSGSTLYRPSDMAAAINGIDTGITPTGAININQNGTVDVTQYASAIVNVNTQTSVTALLEGTSEPSASLGNDGDVYIRYSDFTNSPYVDSGLGWSARSENYVSAADTLLGTINTRSFTKVYSGPAVVVATTDLGASSLNGSGVILLSTVKDNAVYKSSYNDTILQPSYSFSWLGMTWFANFGHAFGVTYYPTDGIVKNQKTPYLLSIENNTVDVFKNILISLGVIKTGTGFIAGKYIKNNGVWAEQ